MNRTLCSLVGNTPIDIQRAAPQRSTSMRRCLFIASHLWFRADSRSAMLKKDRRMPVRIDYPPRGRRRQAATVSRRSARNGPKHTRITFLNFTVDSKRREPNVIFAAKDSKKSHRPRLTVEPFAKAANLTIDTRFGNKQSADLAADLRANQQGKVILICWRHAEIPALLRCAGSKPRNLSAEWQMARCGLQLGHPA